MKTIMLGVNPPKGEKSDFIKASITLPPAVYERVMEETIRRKVAKEPDPSISAIVREALAEYLNRDESGIKPTTIEDVATKESSFTMAFSGGRR